MIKTEQHEAWRVADDQPDSEFVTRYRLVDGGSDDWVDLPWGYRIQRDGERWVAVHDERWARDSA